MRATMHNGRTNRGGKAFSPKHNDRRYDLEKADNLDLTKIKDNLYWNYYSTIGWYREDTKETQLSFDDSEARLYREHFMDMYNVSMEKHRQHRQYARIKPFDEWRKSRQYCPEETYMQVGKVGETIDPQKFLICANIFISRLEEWNEAHGNPFTIINRAIHYDEQVPQIHIRRVWHSINPETGIDEIGQNLALERAGVKLPDETKPRSAKNNRKMTFDKEMRQIWLDVCREQGLDIEETPEEGKKHNMTKQQYLNEQIKAVDEERQALKAGKKKLLQFLSEAETLITDIKQVYSIVAADARVLPKRKQIDQQHIERVAKQLELVKLLQKDFQLSL